METNRYICSNAECISRKRLKDGQKSEDILIPLRLMVCAHSVCELCLIHYSKQTHSSIKCSICEFRSTIDESVIRQLTQYQSEIDKWRDTSAPALVIKMDMNSFPLDFHAIASYVDSGLMTASRTPLTLDIDLDDDMMPLNDISTVNAFNDLTDDDMNAIVSKITKTSSQSFNETVDKAVKSFTDLSVNYTSIRKVSDETNDYFKTLKLNSRELFHKFHSILQLREKEFMAKIDSTEKQRLEELRVSMNEVLSKRSELKGKLMYCSQTNVQNLKVLKKSIQQLIKDSAIIQLNSPENEFKLSVDPNIEEKLKTLGSIKRNTDLTNGDIIIDNGSDVQTFSEMDCDSGAVSSDDEDISYVSADSSTVHTPTHRSSIPRDFVTVLNWKNPYSFYVRKVNDKERFDYLSTELKIFGSNPFLHAPAIELLESGAKLIGYSSVMQCWCRVILIHYLEVEDEELEFEATIFLIDYGTTETVRWYNIREQKKELFDEKEWPPFAIKCSLFNIKPNRNTTDWSQPALDLFSHYIKNNELVLFWLDFKDGLHLVDMVHSEIPHNFHYQIPSIIEVLVYYEYALLEDNIDFNSYLKYNKKPDDYPNRCDPPKLSIVSVLVSHVESPDLFFVHQQKEYQKMLEMINELNTEYNDENSGVYTYYRPRINTPCAALYEYDNRFYRALVKEKGKSINETIVYFVDFGNKASVKNKNLRIIRNSFITNYPIQAIPCSLTDIEPNHGYKWSTDAIKAFKTAISNDVGPKLLTMCAEVVTPQKLEVVLRSYDSKGKEEVVNQVLVREGFALSNGPQSKTYKERVSMMSSQESLNSLSSSSTSRSRREQTVKSLPVSVSGLVVLKEMCERNIKANADKRSSLIKVNICHVINPSKFYVQFDRPELKQYFGELLENLTVEYNSPRHQHLGDTNFIAGDMCAFKSDNEWRRGQVKERLNNLTPIEVPEETKFKVIDIDFGTEYDLRVSKMRRLVADYAKDGSFAVECKLAFLRGMTANEWSLTSIDIFKDSVQTFATELYLLVKDNVIVEPVSVKLYGKQIVIPSAFEAQKTIYNNLSQTLVDGGYASVDRADSSSDIGTDDDININEELPPEKRTEMPFSMFSQTNENPSVLESLYRRQMASNTDLQSTSEQQFTKYLERVYPTERVFYAFPTDLTPSRDPTVSDKFNISFRYWEEGVDWQKIHIIERSIETAIRSRGALREYEGSVTAGTACTAYFEFDKSWNRAEIVGISDKLEKGEPKLMVTFVDYGNSETILIDKLSSEVFGADVPKLAFQCQIIGFVPIDDSAIVPIRNLIYKRVLDRKCRFFWENYPNIKPMKVRAEIPKVNNANEYIPLKDLLWTENLVAGEAQVNDALLSRLEEMQTIDRMVNRTYGTYPVKFDPTKFYRVVMSYELVENYAFFQMNTIMKNAYTEEEVLVNTQHDEFVWMLQEMREEVENCQPLKYFNEGTACLAQFSVDECWYRALIVEVDTMVKIAKVFFVDYGNTEEVEFKNLREIPKSVGNRDFMNPRAHSFLCKISNIKPSHNHSWAQRKDLVDEIVAYLTDISGQELLLAKIKSNTYPYEVDLYIAETEDSNSPLLHAFQDLVNTGKLVFVNPTQVWRKTIEPSIVQKQVKSEPL